MAIVGEPTFESAEHGAAIQKVARWQNGIIQEYLIDITEPEFYQRIVEIIMRRS
jgi:hypothetical protein